MKKKYIRPESQLFVINFSENIADGSVPEDDDFVFSGTCNIYYKRKSDGLLYYTDNLSAPVAEIGNAFAEIMSYILAGNTQLISDCMKY